MNKLQKGFTLIELVISITLLSFITIITTSILQNSIIQRNLYIENSNNLENFNSFFGILLSITIKHFENIIFFFFNIKFKFEIKSGPM